MLERIELRPTSIEKETFPLIVRDKGLYAFTLEGYWMDVGQPKDYLRGQRSVMHAVVPTHRPQGPAHDKPPFCLPRRTLQGHLQS